MLMVAEMTGGYQLLVPAGLAVLLSYLVQFNLSRFVKYRSLYEAQVTDRAGSPAHQAEQVQIAIRLLDHGGIAWPSEVTHLHLASLLQEGIELDLADGAQLIAGILKPESPWAGKQVQQRPAGDALEHSRLLAILRGNSIVLARPDTLLQSGDRLLFIAEPEALEPLQQFIGPPVPAAA
jgi:CIC family chloride channel protein